MSELEKLKQENRLLKQKLSVAKNWMEREVRQQVKKISKRKINKMVSKTKTCFLKENIEEIITKEINTYFWEIMLLNIPSWVIDNIISAEISFYNLKQNPESDWFTVVSSYHKALDSLIESYITKWFRKFAKKKNQIYLRQNDLLEKSLNSVVNKWYILSTWRLFHLIKLIKDNDELFDYWKCFKEYLNKYYYLNDTLLNDDFYENFHKIINSEVLWKKRHSWNITYEETTIARNVLLWNFKDTNSIIYKLVESQNIEF